MGAANQITPRLIRIDGGGHNNLSDYGTYDEELPSLFLRSGRGNDEILILLTDCFTEKVTRLRWG